MVSGRLGITKHCEHMVRQVQVSFQQGRSSEDNLGRSDPVFQGWMTRAMGTRGKLVSLSHFMTVISS